MWQFKHTGELCFGILKCLNQSEHKNSREIELVWLTDYRSAYILENLPFKKSKFNKTNGVIGCITEGFI